MKPVRVRSVSQTTPQNAEVAKIDRLAIIAAILTLIAAVIGTYIAFKNLTLDTTTTVVI
ncbi:hypothetical protein [Paenibacillus physcomitrellae]|uniref:Uncharacterized protein n=1 Tax=Paenibacillus physcomitrellae TaxID=1619311 RepID=A0ABQ1FMH9_9BACL|nr:hypothetical protein [Paenibacillus physcomitrellae]GGA21382.1 hypothetical protein GCM10010917_02620 [Paenibacillus physcomitrellae]